MLSASFSLTPAFQLDKNKIEMFDFSGRFGRSFFVLTFREHGLCEEEEKKRQPPYYGYVGDYFCVLLSVYFGKRFDNLGFLQSYGIHCVPDIQPPKLRQFPDALPVSSKPRKDLEIKLELHEAKPLLPILEAVFLEINENKNASIELDLALTAGRFYLQALQLFESDPELAFLSLVSAGEVLVSGLQFSDDELYDEETQRLLVEIKEKMGEAKAGRLRGRFSPIGRRFRKGLSKLVNKAFFEGSESQEDFAKFRQDDFERRIASAYELRSKFLHTGKRFGVWVGMLDHRNAEVSIWTPA